jgi:hypothetical protein
MEADDSRAVTTGMKAQRELNDIKPGQKDLASLVRSPKSSWWHISRTIEAMRSGYEATIMDLKKQVEKQIPPKQEAEQVTAEVKQADTKPQLGYFDWFR